MSRHRHRLHLLTHLVKGAVRNNIRTLLPVLLFVIINTCLLIQIYANTWVFPHTFLGNTPVSGKTREQVHTLINSFVHTPYTIHVRDRNYIYNLADLGVTIDKNEVDAKVFAANHRIFPLSIIAFIRSLIRPTVITIPLSFTQDFTKFIEQTVYDFSIGQDAIYYDDSNKSLTYVENEDKYRIDEEYFTSLLKEHAGNTSLPLYPKLVRLENSRAQTVADTNDRIKAVVLDPLTVFIDDPTAERTFILTEKELSDIADIRLSPDQTSVTIDIRPQILTTLVNEHAKQIRYLARGNIVTPKVMENIKDVLIARYNGHSINALTLTIDKGPNTTGMYADHYIEVDISQQRMYTFAHGKIVKEYRISTGKDYPTPTGEFKILNKVGVGYSNIYHVWMPYWMGFYYSNSLHAYFGIHELPYYYVGPSKIQRPREFIGSPNTGGCIALDIGAAREVYAFADIGTPVVIFP